MIHKPTPHEVADAKTNSVNFKLIKSKEKGCLLDLGANVGEVSLYAIEKGFGKVVAVEAHPDNFKKMISRGLPKNIEPINKAVHHTSGLKLVVSTPGISTNCTAREKKHYQNVGEDYYREVESVSFQDLLDEYRPDVVKMDIEGGEYECLPGAEFNDNLHFIMVELHGIRNEKRWGKALEIEAHLESFGFKRIKPLSINLLDGKHPRALYCVFVYEREVK